MSDRVGDKIRTFIVETLIDEDIGEGDPLTADEVDSLGLEQLADYIEEEFGVRIEDEDMVRRNFASVATLAAFVESKRALPA